MPTDPTPDPDPTPQFDRGHLARNLCPQCGWHPVADGYSVCELCAYRPGAPTERADPR